MYGRALCHIERDYPIRPTPNHGGRSRGNTSSSGTFRPQPGVSPDCRNDHFRQRARPQRIHHGTPGAAAEALDAACELVAYVEPSADGASAIGGQVAMGQSDQSGQRSQSGQCSGSRALVRDGGNVWDNYPEQIPNRGQAGSLQGRG